jgi:hypothetical protein
MVDKEGKFAIKREDEVIAGSLVGFEGQIVHPKVREILGMAPLTPTVPAAAPVAAPAPANAGVEVKPVQTAVTGGKP